MVGLRPVFTSFLCLKGFKPTFLDTAPGKRGESTISLFFPLIYIFLHLTFTRARSGTQVSPSHANSLTQGELEKWHGASLWAGLGPQICSLPPPSPSLSIPGLVATPSGLETMLLAVYILEWPEWEICMVQSGQDMQCGSQTGAGITVHALARLQHTQLWELCHTWHLPQQLWAPCCTWCLQVLHAVQVMGWLEQALVQPGGVRHCVYHSTCSIGSGNLLCAPSQTALHTVPIVAAPGTVRHAAQFPEQLEWPLNLVCWGSRREGGSLGPVWL